jgi:drug/metabolite transporter (DMT)-like permease
MTAIRQSDIQRGMLFALAGFGMLSIGDAVVKSMAGEWPGTAVAALRYVFGTFMLCTFLAIREGRSGFVTHRPWLHIGRGVSVGLASVFFFLSTVSYKQLTQPTTFLRFISRWSAYQ